MVYIYTKEYISNILYNMVRICHIHTPYVIHGSEVNTSWEVVLRRIQEQSRTKTSKTLRQRLVLAELVQGDDAFHVRPTIDRTIMK